MYYEMFKTLCEKKGVKPSDVSKATGISTATLTSWKQGKYTPKNDKLQKIADYFGVTLDYLISGEDAVQRNGGYYINAETAAQAQEMFDDPEMRVLYDMKRNMDPDKFTAHVEFMKELYRQEHPDFDEGC